MNPAVSVVLPFRNEARWLEAALVSLRRQTWSDFEAVLINDRSEDDSLEIATACCRRDPRFRVVPAQGEGLVAALNTGLAAATGEWVARLDADDICHPDRLRAQLELARRLGPRCVVSCLVTCFPCGALTAGGRNYEAWLNSLTRPAEIARDLFIESPIPHPSAFFHRDSVLQAGGYRDLSLPEDYELWLRLWSQGFSFAKVPRRLLAWRERPDRFSRLSPAYSVTAFYRTKAMYLAQVPCLRGKRVVFAGAGQAARRLSRWLRQEGFTIEAFLGTNPGQAGSTLRGIPVVASEKLDEYPGLPVVAASRQPGARQRIREFLHTRGYREGRDFVMCA